MNSANEHYAKEIATLADQVSIEEGRNRLLLGLRTAAFFAAVPSLLAGYLKGGPVAPLIWIGWILMGAFLVVITLHESVRLKLESLEIRSRLFKRLNARLHRNWKELPKVDSQLPLGKLQSATADDLDVFGTRSLFQWLCLAHTILGRRRLATWLMEWVSESTIVDRQSAVRELQTQRPLRESILYLASLIEDTHANPEAFTAWATGGSWLAKHRSSHWLSWLGPIALMLGIAWVCIARMNEWESLLWPGVAIIFAGCVVNVFLMLGKIGAIHDIFSKINSGHGEVSGYTELYEQISRIQGNSRLLVEMRNHCCEGSTSAVDGFRSLQKLVWMANLQRNPLLYIPYLVLQLLVQWDFRAMELLERWQLKYGSQAGVWLEQLGTLEALLSASTLADENPSWTYPTWSKDSQWPLKIDGLGHPLLQDNQRVPNNLHIDADHRLLLITGSNMAGKSTLLRSLGLNVLIARTGAPICAQSFQGLSFELATSIRVRDSLQDGVSFFMAELHRLRDVVALARHHHQTDHRPVLTLLDEILQGTNSRERQIAVQEVATQLVDLKAITAISTHDLELADQKQFTQSAQIVHFREFFETENGEQKMRFDYVMRPGPTPTTNALKLLEMVGLRTPLSKND